MTVRELLGKIDSRELTEWGAFFDLEPWGTEVEDWRAGMVASVMANANRDPKKRRKPYQPTDFMPHLDKKPKEEQTWEEQAEILDAWGKVWGNNFGDSK